MTQIMTPSKTMTEGQITKAVGNFRAMLEKHAGEFPAEVVQAVLGDPGLAGEMLAVLRRRVEAVSKRIVRKIGVIRNRSAQEALKATGRAQYRTGEVVNAMPNGENAEEEIFLFKLDLSKRGGWISDNDLMKEFDLRGLKPVDPFALAALNEADPDFADEKPNATHWKDADGNWCYAVFGRWDGERRVYVCRYDEGLDDRYCVAGVRK